MNYEEYEINNVKVYIYKTTKFKTIKINMMLINEYSKNDFTKNRLLNRVLIRSTKKYDNQIKIGKKSIDLYNPSGNIFDSFKKYHEKNFTYTFLNEKYTEPGMNKKNIEFMFEVIFNPNIVEDHFEPINFNISKQMLESDYKMDEENPNYVADEIAYSLISEDLPCKLQKNGTREELKNIDEKELYNFYLKQIKNSEYKIFIVGDVDTEDILSILKQNLKDKNIKKISFKGENFIIKNKTKKPTEKIEKKPYNQSVLLIIYKIINMTEYEKNYVLPILNTLLGGNSFRLFNSIREKNSLAYYISTYTISNESVFEIEAGIAKSNLKKTVELVKKEIIDIKKANITNEEIKDIIEMNRSALDSLFDNLNSILGVLITMAHSNKEDPFKKFEKLKKVSKKEISKLAGKLNLDVIFLLEGTKNGNN